MTEKAIQSLENAMENIAESIEAMTKSENVSINDVAHRINAITRMDRLLPGAKGTALPESDNSNRAE